MATVSDGGIMAEVLVAEDCVDNNDECATIELKKLLIIISNCFKHIATKVDEATDKSWVSKSK